MVLIAIFLGFVGAFLATTLDVRLATIVLGFLGGVAVAEYLRITQSLERLQKQIEDLQTLDNLKKLAQRENGKEVQPKNAAPPSAKVVATNKQQQDDSLTPEFASAQPHTLESPSSGALPDGKVATASPSPPPGPTPIDTKPPPQRTAARQHSPFKKKPNALQAIIGRTSVPTRIGIVVLFFGVSFLLRYAAERGYFPEEARLLLVIVLGSVIYQVGRKLQQKERSYGLLLRGAAIGIWYLSCYAAFSLYELIGATTSFVILAALSAFTAWNAVRHNTKAMAMLGIVGGFLAPILLASGEGNHVVLFTYYAVINAGIVAIAYRQTWLELPMAGFLFTFVVGAFWGANSYQTEFFATTEPFLLLSALFYLCVPLLFANQVKQGKFPLYGNIIVFGAPAIAFTLQLRLVSEFEHGDTWSAFGFASVYAAVLALLWRWLSATAPILRDAFFAIASVFFTLGIAFVFDQQVAGALWALEAVGGVWLASRQQRIWGCYLSLLILLGAGVLWLLDSPAEGERILLNSAYLEIAIIALAGLAIAYILDRRPGWLHDLLPRVASGWAAAWWLAGGIWQISYHLGDANQLPAFGLYVLCTSAALLTLYYFTAWRLAGSLAGFAMLLTGGLGLVASSRTGGPLQDLGLFVWPLTVIYFYAATYALSASSIMKKLCSASYILVAALLVTIGGTEFYLFFTGYFPAIAGRVIGISVVPFIVFWLAWRGRAWRPEFEDLHRGTITVMLAGSLALCFYLGLIVEPGIESTAGTLRAWPLNLLQFALLVSLALWWRDQGSPLLARVSRNQGWLFLGASVFLFANAIVLRFIHIHQVIPYDVADLFGSDTVQTTLSIFWTLCGVVAVMWSSRNYHYLLWNVGMALLAVVVAKLFLVDLAQSGTIERIVSFIAVGLLLMAVGWRSPRPHKSHPDSTLSATNPTKTMAEQ